jgi:exonuclease VII small subunit
MAEPTQITFEQGWDELQAITARLDEGVPVEETIKLLRTGRGLARTLGDYLTKCEGEISEIEAGRGLPEYVIAAVSDGPPTAVEPTVEPQAADFARAGADDDIPF